MRYFTTLEQKLYNDKRIEMKQLASIREQKERSGKTVTNMDLLQALSTVLKDINNLQATGAIDKDTALRLVKRIRTVAMDATVGLEKSHVK